MQLPPFHAYYQARILSGYAYGRDRLTAVLAFRKSENVINQARTGSMAK